MADALRVGINGLGRIGRLVVRALMADPRPVDFVLFNDLTPTPRIAHLLAHDSVHGRFEGTVEAVDDGLVVNGDRLLVTRHADVADLPWAATGADVVVEASGRHRSRDSLQGHLDAGAGRVLLTAPSPDADVMVVTGVNDAAYDPARHRIVSNASCTTNCLAPLLKVLDDAYGVEAAAVTTVHAATNDQRLLDADHTDLRRARSALVNIIPTATGAARAIGQIMPHLAGRVDGMAVRVPTPDVSLVDATVRLTASDATAGLDAAAVVAAFDAAAATAPLAGILRVEHAPLVSGDFRGDPASAIIDAPATQMLPDNMVKVLAWYDNEWAYACRLAEWVHRLGPDA